MMNNENHLYIDSLIEVLDTHAGIIKREITKNLPSRIGIVNSSPAQVKKAQANYSTKC